MSEFGRQVSSGIETRALRLEDVDAVAALIEACDRSYLDWAPEGWSPPEISGDREKWRRRLSEDERWTLGAFEGERLVAMASLREARAQEGDPLPGRGHLGALFVHPDRWRRGLGAALLERAEQAMRDLGYSTAELLTPEGAPAQVFYERLGWSPTGQREFKDDFGLWMIEYEKALS